MPWQRGPPDSTGSLTTRLTLLAEASIPS